MTHIEDAAKTVNDFLMRILNPVDLKVVKVSKMTEGWETEAEVYEECACLKALGLPTKVQDKNLYRVKLSGDMEVEGYELLKREEKS